MTHPGTEGAGVRRVLWITLFLNLAVSAAKVVVGTLSGSVSMVADGYHSLVDGSNNVIGLIVAAFAYAPPDKGHPYGHRKFETAATPSSEARSCFSRTAWSTGPSGRPRATVFPPWASSTGPS